MNISSTPYETRVVTSFSADNAAYVESVRASDYHWRATAMVYQKLCHPSSVPSWARDPYFQSRLKLIDYYNRLRRDANSSMSSETIIAGVTRVTRALADYCETKQSQSKWPYTAMTAVELFGALAALWENDSRLRSDLSHLVELVCALCEQIYSTRYNLYDLIDNPLSSNGLKAKDSPTAYVALLLSIGSLNENSDEFYETFARVESTLRSLNELPSDFTGELESFTWLLKETNAICDEIHVDFAMMRE